MARVAVLYGPPAIGKSATLRNLVKRYPNDQFVIVDKDVINSPYFLRPKIDKAKDPDAYEMVWGTAEKIVDFASVEMRPHLQSHAGKTDLTIVLQAVTLGGVENEMERLLDRGFELEFILLTCNDPEILDRRIKERAKEPNFIGAAPMKKSALHTYMRKCNESFAEIVRIVNPGPGKRATKMETFSTSGIQLVSTPPCVHVRPALEQKLRDHHKRVDYWVNYTTLPDGVPARLLPKKHALFETKLQHDIYKRDDISLVGNTVRLDKGMINQYTDLEI